MTKGGASASSVATTSTQNPSVGSNPPGTPPPKTLANATVFSSVQNSVRAGAIRVKISNPDVAILLGKDSETTRTPDL